jgi:hypothetical protein
MLDYIGFPSASGQHSTVPAVFTRAPSKMQNSALRSLTVVSPMKGCGRTSKRIGRAKGPQRACCRQGGRGHVTAAINPETAGREPRDRAEARDVRDGRIPDDRSQIVRTDYTCAQGSRFDDCGDVAVGDGLERRPRSSSATAAYPSGGSTAPGRSGPSPPGCATTACHATRSAAGGCARNAAARLFAVGEILQQGR